MISFYNVTRWNTLTMALQLQQLFEILYGHPIPIYNQPYKAKKYDQGAKFNMNFCNKLFTI